jgi:hypothetical protein
MLKFTYEPRHLTISILLHLIHDNNEWEKAQVSWNKHDRHEDVDGTESFASITRSMDFNLTSVYSSANEGNKTTEHLQNAWNTGVPKWIH